MIPTATDGTDGHRTVHIEQSIEVDASVRDVYSQWTLFDWSDEFAGGDVDWNAAILEARVDQHIEWRAGERGRVHGIVDFEALSGARTRVALRLDCKPMGLLGRLVGSLGLAAATVTRELRRFQEAISMVQHRLTCMELRRREIERFQALTAGAVAAAEEPRAAVNNTAADRLVTLIKGEDRVEAIGRGN